VAAAFKGAVNVLRMRLPGNQAMSMYDDNETTRVGGSEGGDTSCTASVERLKNRVHGRIGLRWSSDQCQEKGS
jgi:hypothetical protein